MKIQISTSNSEHARISKDADAALKEIRALMKAKGYSSKASTQSAIREYTFTKQGKPIYLTSVWHGTGNYGSRTAIFSLYLAPEDKPWGSKLLYSWTIDESADAHSKNAKQILEYLKKNA